MKNPVFCRSSLFFILLLLSTFSIQAQKSVYIPSGWVYNFQTKEYTENGNQDLQWSFSRSKETDNCIIFWQKGFGSDPNQAPSLNGTDMTIDIDDILAKAEAFYELECSQLGFVNPETSNLRKYKMMILMNYTTTWTCYGGGYDFQVPALWLNPATCKPAGSALAHEVGHSFHYMCYAEDSNHGRDANCFTGFHGAIGIGSTIWETTANWQALQSYPEEVFTESGMADIFQKSHNYAFIHEWQRYQSYMFFIYLVQKYNDIRTIANVWNTHETSNKDFNEVLMDCKSLSVDELYHLHFAYALHAVTYDFDFCKPYMKDSYIGKFNFNKVKLAAGKYQVAYSSCPQSTGFNVIPLNVPASGTTITTKFTALTPGCSLATGDPAEYLNSLSSYTSSGRTTYNPAVAESSRGFRIGYVVLKKDGTREYFDDNSIHCTGTGEQTENITLTVPENASRMWLVVSPTPSTYIQHKWDENVENDDQWPYQVEFVNTDILGEPTLDGRAIANATITYDVTLRPASDFSGATITFNASDMATIGTAFQLGSDDIFSRVIDYNTNGPEKGQIMNYAANADGSLQETGRTTNPDFGHWFQPNGNAAVFGNNTVVFAEFSKSNKSVTVGQFPNANSDGTRRTIREALKYRDMNDNTAIVYLVFNVTFDSSATSNSYTISNIELSGLKGDVNLDGNVDISDVVLMVNYILGDNSLTNVPKYGDMNEDNNIDISDVVALVNIILGN